MVPVIIISIFCCFVMFNAKSQNMLPNFFGYSAVTIVSGSMEASGFFIGKSVVVQTPNPKGLEVGDIIAFYNYPTQFGAISPYSFPEYEKEIAQQYSKIGDLSLEYILGIRDESIKKAASSKASIYFHQIIDIRRDPDTGTLWFRTKGTSNAVADPFWLKEDYIVGVYTDMPEFVSTVLTFVGSPTGIVWMVIIPIAIIMFLLIIEFIDNWDRYEIEQKLIKGKIYLTDKICVDKNIGYDMNKKNKLIVLAHAPNEYKQAYTNLMWKEGSEPKGLLKHIKKQNWGDREVEKLENTKKEIIKEYKETNDAKLIDKYQEAVEKFNELEYKIRGEYYHSNEITKSKQEQENEVQNNVNKEQNTSEKQNNTQNKKTSK